MDQSFWESNRQFLKVSRRFAWPLWPWYLGGAAALVATNLLMLEIPLIAKHIVNHAEDVTSRGGLTKYAYLLMALGCLTIVIRALSRILVFHPGRMVEREIRSAYFSRMMRLTESFYNTFGMGELVSRLTNDTGQLRAFYAFGVLQVLNLIFLSVFSVRNMWTIHPQLTLVAIGPLALMVIIMRFSFHRSHELSLKNQEAVGRLTNRVTEAFVNIHVIQSNSVEGTFFKRAETEAKEVMLTDLRTVALRTLLFPLISMTANLGQVAVVFYGGSLVIQKQISIGDILAFNVYIAYLSFPLSAIGIIVSLYQRCLVGLKRLREIEVAPEESGVIDSLDSNQPLLSVRGLQFGYGSKAFTFGPMDLELRDGEKIGLFGPIGSGKTTFFSLLTRIYDPPPGQIFFRGVDITQLKPDLLRTHCGLSQQSPTLFSDSVAENLILGSGIKDSESMKQAAAAADILHDIERMPEGWSTTIGEKGLRLSGGQKQRLALARVFLRKPELLLLDDVLSAVDSSTEQHITDSIRATRNAVIVASHRISALKDCREIIYLDHGKVVDRGSFSELASRHAVFREERYDG